MMTWLYDVSTRALFISIPVDQAVQITDHRTTIYVVRWSVVQITQCRLKSNTNLADRSEVNSIPQVMDLMESVGTPATLRVEGSATVLRSTISPVIADGYGGL